MITATLVIAALSMAIGLVGLLSLGARWQTTSLAWSLSYAVAVVALAGLAAHGFLGLAGAELWAGLLVAFAGAAAAGRLRPDWSPPAQAFFGVLAVSCLAFVVHAVGFTFTASLPALGYPASLILVALEVGAFTLLLIGTHETLDVVSRVRWRRRAEVAPADGFTPFVSVHVPTHNEPPELVIETLSALRRLDYPAYEVIVLDNNTDDPDLWRPVAEYCEQIGFRFVHLEDWPGFKAGALNHGLEILDPRTEVVAVVDADFVVKEDFLRQSVGAFRDPAMGIVQTTQKFRSEQGDQYLRRLGLTYQSFDEISMPSRNERNGIIFAGTMGLIRRQALVEAGGWGEWCVTEDAEVSLRILARGYDGIYLERSFGTGVMPLTFAGLKGQRFRWCLGGVQLLRKHWRLIVTGRGVAGDGTRLALTPGQRYDFFAGALQWFQAPLSIAFAGLLTIATAAWALGLGVTARPLVGLFVAVPSMLLVTSLLRALWGLRARLRVSLLDAAAAMAIFLSMTWAVALACVRGVSGSGISFLRTPKFAEHESLKQVLASTRAETPLALALTTAAVLTVTTRSGFDAVFLTALCAWSALLFGSAPATALAASRHRIRSVALRRRRELESERRRVPVGRRVGRLAYAGAAATACLAIIVPGVALSPGGQSFADILRPQEDRETPGLERGGGLHGGSSSSFERADVPPRRNGGGREQGATGTKAESRGQGSSTGVASHGTGAPGGASGGAGSQGSQTSPSAPAPPASPGGSSPGGSAPGSGGSDSAPVPTEPPTAPAQDRPTRPASPAPETPTGPGDVARSGQAG